MKIFYKHFIAILTLALVLSKAHAQYDNFLPSSSSGTPEVNTNTGGIHHSLPLMTYNSLSLSMPIGLVYESTGVRVDERSSQVGHNWKLTAGGKITRTIRDQRDPLEHWDQNYPLSIDPNTQAAEDFFEAGETEDREPDLFSFSFPGYSGSFVIGENLEPILIPYQPLDISITTETYTPEPDPNAGSGGWSGGGTQTPDPDPITLIESIKITTPEGMIYTFGGPQAYETSTSWRTIEYNFENSANIDTEPGEMQRTGWHLTSMKNQYGDEINIQYQHFTRTYVSGKSHIKRTWEMYNASSLDIRDNQIFKNWVTYNTPHIQEITSSTIDAKVNFDYVEKVSNNDTLNVLEYVSYWPTVGTNTDRFNLAYQLSKGRAFLQEVDHTNAGGVSKAVYKFEYNDVNGLPNRLSFAQDHWGYYNGVTNNDAILEFVPKRMHDLTNNERFDEYFENKGADREPNIVYAKKGLLTKVTYPTGSQTLYEYEANVENLEPDQSGGYSGGRVIPDPIDFSVQSCNTTQTDSKTITSSFGQLIKLSSDLQGSNQAEISVYQNNTNSYLPGLQNKIIQSGEIIEFEAEISESFEISVTSLSSGNCVKIDPDFNNMETPGDIIFAEVGGVRLKRVIQKDPHSNYLDTTRFYYGPKHAPFLNSGLRQVTTDYYSYFFKYMHTDVAGNPNWYIGYTIRSNSGNIQNSTNGGQVQYEHITASYGGDNFENGGVQYDYHVDFYEAPEEIYGTYGVQDAPWSTTNWLNGKLKTKEVFKYVNDQFVTLQRSNNNYAPVESNGQLFGYAQVWMASSNYHRSVEKYKYQSLWSYLLSTTSTTYDDAGNNPITNTVTYNYDSPNHKFLTSVSSTDSRGREVRTAYKYPQDYTAIDRSTLEGMLHSNLLLSSPIETMVYHDGVPIHASAVGYESMNAGRVIPKYSYVAENTGQAISWSANGETFSAPYHLESEVLVVNDKGQTLSMVGSDDLVVNFVRGKNDRHVLAKIFNVNYTAIATVLSQESNNSETSLSSGLEQALRDIPDARVETYSYREGYGIASKTDVNGRTQYYEYNDKGELLYIKDHEGNVLSKQVNNIKN